MSVNPKRLAEKENSQAYGGAVVIFDADKRCWILPGGRKIFNEQHAQVFAVRLNALMKAGECVRGTGVSRVRK